MKKWQIAAYRIWQWTWGLPQTLLGLVMVLKYRRCPRKRVGGAIATLHDGNWGGVSLGMFIFVPGGLKPEREAKLLAHAGYQQRIAQAMAVGIENYLR